LLFEEYTAPVSCSEDVGGRVDRDPGAGKKERRPGLSREKRRLVRALGNEGIGKGEERTVLSTLTDGKKRGEREARNTAEKGDEPFISQSLGKKGEGRRRAFFLLERYGGKKKRKEGAFICLIKKEKRRWEGNPEPIRGIAAEGLG